MPFVSRAQQGAICSKKDAASQRACKEMASKTNFKKLPAVARKKKG